MQYIVLLRGINVGGRTIKMADLKACFEQAGYRSVQTLLQTGNVILEGKETTEALMQQAAEALLNRTFHYPARVVVLTPRRLREVIGKYPFGEPAPDLHRYIVFTEPGYAGELAGQAGPGNTGTEQVVAGKDVVYWQVPRGETLTSPFGKLMAKVSRRHLLTNRNVNTLEKILAKCGTS